MAKSKNFVFDGGAGTYLGTSILAFLVTVLSLGIAYPFSLVLRQRWKAKHIGWGGGTRTPEWRHQKPLPYHLATPHRNT